jgi:hypothetical protein
MTDNNADRDATTGQFVVGHTGHGGRPRGARNRLGEQFLEDLRDCWQRKGMAALEACADDDPAAFVRCVASLMPKDLNINANLSVDVADHLQKLRMLAELVGVELDPVARRKPLRIIDGR